jgi:hypothetical protein
MADRRRTPEEMLSKPEPTQRPPSMMQATPLRQEVQDTVREATRSSQMMRLYNTAYTQLSGPILEKADPATARKLRDSQLHRFLG